MGTVYLIHFDRPLQHARHYVGFTEADDVTARLGRHRSGDGAKLLRAVAAAGIGFRVVREWWNVDRNFERKIKNRRSTPVLCPVCREKELAKNRQCDRKRRRAGRRKPAASVSANEAISF